MHCAVRIDDICAKLRIELYVSRLPPHILSIIKTKNRKNYAREMEWTLPIVRIELRTPHTHILFMSSFGMPDDLLCSNKIYIYRARVLSSSEQIYDTE